MNDPRIRRLWAGLIASLGLGAIGALAETMGDGSDFAAASPVVREPLRARFAAGARYAPETFDGEEPGAWRRRGVNPFRAIPEREDLEPNRWSEPLPGEAEADAAGHPEARVVCAD
jgi:hypothetical protein